MAARPRDAPTRPTRILMVVLFPAPFGPTNPKIDPSRTRRSRSSSATTFRIRKPRRYVLPSPSMSSASAMSADVPAGEDDGREHDEDRGVPEPVRGAGEGRAERDGIAVRERLLRVEEAHVREQHVEDAHELLQLHLVGGEPEP